MTKQMILANLFHRPVRTSVSILAVGIEVTLILVVAGLATGMTTETGKRIQGIGADIMFQSPNSSIFLAFNNAAMPLQIGDKLREVEGVKAVTPVLTQFNAQGGFDIIYGIDLESFNAVTGGFLFHQGRPFSRADEILVDDWYARSKALVVGDEATLLNHKFRVAGIIEHGKGARIFMPLKTAEEMLGSAGRVSMFLVKCETPEETYKVISRLGMTFPSYPARPLREFVSLMSSTTVPALDAFLRTVVFVAISIGVLVIFLSMYTTITERTREIGILRSLGASKRFIVTLILQESVLISVLGILLGLGLSVVVARAVSYIFPTLVVMISTDWMAKASLFALLSGVVGGIYPSLKAASQDPVEALAYE